MPVLAPGASPRALRLARRAGVAALALVAACSRDAVDPKSPPVTDLAAGPERALAPLPEPRVVSLPVPSELAPWTVEAKRYEILPPEHPRRGDTTRLELGGVEPKRIVVPGPFQPGDMNRVLVQAQLFNSANITAELLRDGEPVLRSNTVSLAFAKESQTIVLDFPHVRGLDGAYDALAIRIHGQGLTRVEHLSFVEQPLEAWLPRGDGPPTLVEIAAECRRAKALTSEAPWTARARPPRGGELSICYGVPLHLHHPGETPATLRVVLRAEDGDERVASFALDDPPERQRWHTARIPLADFAGRELALRFEIDPGGPGLALCALGELRIVAPRPDVPTVLLVTSDTHRADYLGLAKRGVSISTPHLDALADRGVWFEDCFSSTNVTNPSHIALMTATHPRDTRILDNRTPLSEAAPTLADRFREAGYVTFAAVSTRHLGDDVSGLGQGFDRMSWPPSGGDRAADGTIDVLQAWLPDAEGLPLFVWLHAFDAHSPYEPPPEYAKLYYDPQNNAFDPEAPPLPVEPRLIPTFLTGLKDFAYPEAMYRGEISHLDQELARLFDAPRFRDGVIAFTADHGENLGQHGIFYDHGDLYTDTIHVPLILSWPGGPKGLRSPRPVRQIDVGRTLLDLAGLSSAEFPGSSVATELQDAAEHAPRFAVASNFASAAISSGGWHLIVHLRAHAERNRLVPAEKHQVELYDLRTDPGCEHDLLEREFGRATAMRRALMNWLAASRDTGWALESRRDSALLDQLAKLGYVDDDSSGGIYEVVDPNCDCAWCRRFE